ncbi:MAG: M23 family metallopeptidase [Deltaproteobacteria bacterium]|nr:M23 family metallopeptidase [Deltaproteobacteria bacterium]
MGEIALITVAGQILMPLALLVWQWRGHCVSRMEWVLKSLVLCAYLGLTAVVGIGLLAPWYVPYGFAVLGATASVSAWRGTGRCPVAQTDPWAARMRRGSWAAVAALCFAVLAWALSGYLPPGGPAVRLASPLKNGEFYVVNGGYSILINPHMKTLERESLRAYRGQSYALDIVKLNRYGFRAQGVWPRDLAGYEIFGEPLYAPCDGEVLFTEYRLPDRVPPEYDRQNPAGNFVYLQCSAAGVVLAHLMQSSVAVAPGDRVREGQRIGRVGNSGYSTEPHLHIHAQRSGGGADFLAADPLPLQVEGRTLVRNSRIDAR